jgi:hypothetical protein
MYHEDYLRGIMNRRGFTLMTTSGDRGVFIYAHTDSTISCTVYMSSGEWELTASYKIVRLSTGKCGSLEVDSHFNRIFNQIWSAINKLREGESDE